QTEPLTAIDAGSHPLPPPAILEVPRHRLAQPGIERFARRPAQLSPNSRRVDGVTEIVARAIRHESDQRLVPSHRRVGAQLVEQRTNLADDVDIAALAVATDEIRFADSPKREHRENGV